MRIYIAGKYTGLPRLYAVAKFNATEQQLIEAGIPAESIVNPVKLVPPNTEWKDCMDNYCLPTVKECTAIFMQYDWTDSPGARLELTEAMRLKLDVFFEASNDMKAIKNLIDTMV